MDTEHRRNLARNIRRLRQERDWTQNALAAKTTIKTSAISYMEREDEKSPTLGSIETVAKALGVPAWALLLDVSCMTPAQMRAMDRLVDVYLRLPDSAREQILRVADAEARYANHA